MLERLAESFMADMCTDSRLVRRSTPVERSGTSSGLRDNSRSFFKSDSDPQYLPAPFQSIDGHYLRYVTFGK